MTISPLAAILALSAKLALPTETFTEIWGAQHARAFVVAGANTEAIVTDFHEAVKKAQAEGQTREDFQKSFDAIVAKHGWSYKGKRRWRSNVIYDTNMRQAWLTAKWQRFWENRKSRPFLMYQAVRDKKTRPQHLEWHGVILPIAHPWWDSHYPMNGWGCRCDVRALDQATMDREGLSVQPEAPASPMVTREVRSAAGRFFETVPRGIDPGFNYNVGRASSGGPPPVIMPASGAEWPRLLAPGAIAPANLPPLPRDTTKAKIAAPTTPEQISEREALFQNVIGGPSAILTDPTGTYIEITTKLFDHIKDKSGYRFEYLPFLPELIADPAEIWIGFNIDPGNGRTSLRRRYVKLLDLGNGRVITLVCEIEKRQWVGLTFFVGKENDLNNTRWGFLAYRRKVE